MIAVRGRSILGGYAKGPALITDMAVNFTAAFTKPPNLLPWNRSLFCDRHHPWFRENITDKVLFFPACIGSTHTGLVVLDLVRLGHGPAAMIIEEPDPLIVSGVVSSAVWYDRAVPIIELPLAAVTGHVRPGQQVEVFGDSGKIVVLD